MSTRIIRKITKLEFKKLVKERKDDIKVSGHAFDHINKAQREIFTEESLKEVLLRENPKLVGIQDNMRYASYYSKKYGFLKLILNIKEIEIEIITFIKVRTIPQV
jgi:hypothetical protein